ncbi:MAG: ribose 5-phosphate isomerase B [Flavobacteriales bacterium]|nr:ribose 5-phosphate isomerase B [Flavobacteriales bacterium]|tara:strand:+ start:4202 stop:4621 length:420 start_codon:yes stop_codon:yes gene_type:complete
MKITIGSDHAGVDYKLKIKIHLEKQNHKVKDVGTFGKDSVDYPDYAHLVSKDVSEQKSLGILICGSGNGVSMAANKHKNIRAALCWNKEISKLARQHNDANIISLPSRFLSVKDCIELVEVFINEPFEGGRHEKRVKKI